MNRRLTKPSPTQAAILKRMCEGIPLRHVHRKDSHLAWLNEPPHFWGGRRVKLPTFRALRRERLIEKTYHDHERTMYRISDKGRIAVG